MYRWKFPEIARRRKAQPRRRENHAGGCAGTVGPVDKAARARIAVQSSDCIETMLHFQSLRGQSSSAGLPPFVTSNPHCTKTLDDAPQGSVARRSIKQQESQIRNVFSRFHSM